MVKQQNVQVHHIYPGLNPSEGAFLTKLSCQREDSKEKRWYKYVFGHCVSERVCFRGGLLV